MYRAIECTQKACPDAEKARSNGPFIKHVLAAVFRVLSPRNPYKTAKPQEKEIKDQI
jgi:hypothetical protein